MNAGGDEIIHEPAEYVGFDVPGGIDRRDEIGKDAVEIRHAETRARFNRA
jgi:hypothetical protein